MYRTGFLLKKMDEEKTLEEQLKELKVIRKNKQKQDGKLQHEIKQIGNQDTTSRLNPFQILKKLEDIYNHEYYITKAKDPYEYAEKVKQSISSLGSFDNDLVQDITDYFFLYEWFKGTEHDIFTAKIFRVKIPDRILKGNFGVYGEGILLTKVIEQSCEDRIYILLKSKHHDGKKINYLGWEMDTDKEIFLEGDIGVNCGAYMKNGRIYVKGNAMPFCGAHMKGGEIHVERDAGSYCGKSMKGGLIIVEKNVSSDVGYQMRGGTIKIYGKKPKIDYNTIFGGEIYWNDTRLFPK